MAKRGNGERSIRRRKDGRYEGRYVSGGWQRSVYGKTRKEAVKPRTFNVAGETTCGRHKQP